MSQRMEGGWRALTILWQGSVGWVLASVVGFVGAFWMIVDIIWQIATGRNDLNEQSQPAQFISDTISWNAGQVTFAITGGGDGEFRALP